MRLYSVVIDGLINEDRVLVERHWHGKTEVRGKKNPRLNATVPTTNTTSTGWDWTWVSSVKGRWLTPWGRTNYVYVSSLLRSLIEIDRSILEQVKHFNDLGCELSLDGESDFDKEINRFQGICGTIRKHLEKTRTETQMKFYKVVARPSLLWAT